MDLLLNIISVLAFVMTSITWIVGYFSRRLKISVEIKDHAKRRKVVQFYLYLQNKSSSPVTISGISILDNAVKYPCEYYPKIIRTRNNDVVIQTPYLPVNLAAHQGACYAFEFLNCQDIELVPGKTVELEIYTNRKPLTKSLVLPPEGNILHLRN